MAQIKLNREVDEFLDALKKWQDEMRMLRNILADCSNELTEEIKWGKPCYTFNGGNVALIHEFKEYCAILFVKGVLLKDPAKVLVQQTENVQAGRQIRFASLDDIAKLKDTIIAYLDEALAIEKAGLKVEMKKTEEYKVPEELQSALDNDAALKEAFRKLTPGRQRAYIYYISQTKQSATRQSRVERNRHRILDGLGLND